MATENQTLGKALGTDMTPAPFKEPDYSKLTTLPQVLAEKQRIGILQAEAASELKKAELTQQANLAGEQAKVATDIATKARTYVDDNRKKEAEFPYPEFHPTKDNAQSLAGLFSIVSTLGIMLGSSGKQSALNAMGAMNGMMTGWQKGRADLFKREKEEFDKEFNRIKVLRESLRKDLEDYMKLLPYDKEAAMYKAAEITAKAGSDSIISANMKKGLAENNLQILASAEKMIQHKDEMTEKRLQREADRELKKELAQMRYGEERLSGKEREEKRGAERLSTEMERLRSTFKPEYANFKADTLGELSALYQARLRDDPEMANWWRAYENVAMPERHAMFGAALTGGEQASWRRSSIGPGNSNKEIENWFGEKERILDNKIDSYSKVNKARKALGGFESSDDPAGIFK